MKYLIYLVVLSAVTFTSCSEDDDTPDTPVRDLRITSHETTVGNWSLKVNYAYKDGQVHSIEWERAAPNITTGADVLEYDENGKLKTLTRTIAGLVDETISFSWIGDNVVTSVSSYNGKKRSFTFYDYNELNQLVKTEYYAQNSAETGYLFKEETDYTYYPDGNLHQVRHYLYSAEQEDRLLYSVRTYADYLDSPVPVQDIEVLPHLILQKNPAGTYTYQQDTNISKYTYTYTLRADGYPSERLVTYNGATNERTVYTYAEMD